MKYIFCVLFAIIHIAYADTAPPKITIGNLDGQAVNAQGLAVVKSKLYQQSADGTHPGLINISAQDIAGVKTFLDGITGTLTGNADTASALASDPSACGAGDFVNDIDANGTLHCGTPSGASGTVTSVTATVPSYMSISGSPVTTSGTLGFDFGAQSGNKFLASPSNGSSGALDMRAIVAADIPTLNQSTTGNADTATALSANPSACSSDRYVTDTDANGTLTCNQVTDAGLSTSYLKADGTRALTGNWNVGAFTITSPTFIGALTGNSSTSTALAANPSACLSDRYVIDTDANGTLSCSQVTDAGLSTSYLKSDGTRGLSADWNAGAHDITANTFIGALTGLASTATTATNATNTAIADDTTTSATMYPTWVTTASGNQAQKVSSTKLTFNPSTANLTTTTFTGALAGNATTATTATNSTNVGITDDTTTNNTMYPTWVTTTTGNLPEKISSTKLTFNPSTGLLTSTGFSGPLTGAVTGTASGNATTTLNNIASTDMSAGLTFASGVAGVLKTINAAGATQALSITTGDSSLTATDSGALTVKSGNGSVTNNGSGAASYGSGSAVGTRSSGAVTIGSGSTGAAASGALTISTGDSTARAGSINILAGGISSGGGLAGVNGNILVRAGVGASGTANGVLTLSTSDNTPSKTGAINITTGTAGGSQGSGLITLTVGPGGGTRGKITFVDGTEGTSGHAWKSTNTTGGGNWGVLGVVGGGTSIAVGTSGGVPYFNATTTMASSALLAQNGVMLGGGAGAAPTTLATDASTTKVLTSGGTNVAPTWTAIPNVAGTVCGWSDGTLTLNCNGSDPTTVCPAGYTQRTTGAGAKFCSAN